MKIVRLLIPTERLNADTRAAIEAGTIKKLADYPDQVLVEVASDVAEDLGRRGVESTVQAHDRQIRLHGVHLDTTTAPPRGPDAFHLSEARIARRASSHHLVQLVGPARPEWGAELRALGVKTRGFIPENTLLVDMTGAQRVAVEALPFVVWVGLYEPSYKVQRGIFGLTGPVAGAALGTLQVRADAVPRRAEGNLSVRLHDAADRAEMVRRVKELGGTVVRHDGAVLLVDLPPEKIADLAQSEAVCFIEGAPVNVLGNDVAAGIIRVQQVRDTRGLDGAGQIVGISDTGLDTGVDDNTMHQDFRGRIVAIHDRSGNGADDTDGHGTHVAGSVLGNGSASNGTIRGMAPAAQLVFQALEDAAGGLSGIPADLNTLFQQAYDDGARIHSNSWGERDTHHGEYRGSSEDIDEFSWDNKDMCILFLAHNAGADGNNDGVVDTGSMCPQACAKNAISVGASENNRATGGSQGTWSWVVAANPIAADTPSDDPEGMAPFSSRGPTDDGRIKPDVVAPGTNVLSVRSTQAAGTGWGLLPVGDTNRADYLFNGGTSMATPITAGTVALIRQYLVEVHLVASPPSALLKAILVHGAHEMAGQYAAPDNDVGAVPDNSQGWGRVDLKSSLFPPPPVFWAFRCNPADAVATGDNRDLVVRVSDSSVPLRATLVWTDFPSTVAAGGGLVNQLRLQVIPPVGATIQGGPANNNVQQVVVDNPAIGAWTLRVRGVNVATVATTGARQDYALVWSGGLEFVDVYIRDNVDDDGRPPSRGTMYQSPDIGIRLDVDPASPTVGNPEYGQTNYVTVTVRSRGSLPAPGARVRFYWANAGVNLSRPFWKTDGVSVDGVAGNLRVIDVPARAGGMDGSATAVFEWTPPNPGTNLTNPGHFCLFATVDHDDDPLVQEDVDRVPWEDNLAWRNVDIQDTLPNGEAGMEFFVAGRAGHASKAELRIDRSGLPAGGSARLKVPSRYLQGTRTGLDTVWTSSGGLVSEVAVEPGPVGVLGEISLKPGENTRVRLEVTLPADAVDGELYTVFVEQRTDGVFTGRVTLLARTVGTPSHVGNRRSGELHLVNCPWVDAMSWRNKVPYNEPNLALQRGYNGCASCMPEVDTDRKK